MSHGAYQICPPDGYVVIDSAFDEAGLRAMNPDAELSADGYAAIQRALAGARKIVITHEHADHSGGFATYDTPKDLVGRLELTREQLGNSEQPARASRVPRRRAHPDRVRALLALAPGLVLVKAAGHTPGSQMVFVKLADGKEYLFVGDVAWRMDQIRELWYRPRLVTGRLHRRGSRRGDGAVPPASRSGRARAGAAGRLADVDQRKSLIERCARRPLRVLSSRCATRVPESNADPGPYRRPDSGFLGRRARASCACSAAAPAAARTFRRVRSARAARAGTSRRSARAAGRCWPAS
jgi:hypothetical protein